MIAIVLFALSGILFGTVLGNLIGNAIGFFVVARPRRDFPWNWRALVHVDAYFSWLDRQP